ncbi:Nn.00g058040.m01.CDS01 [Neocucurbitaria sp. VM-36]
MILAKRYCVQYDDGDVRCYDEDGFWYSDKGVIIKWVLLALIFFTFFGWFLGGYIHAKRRLKKGQPLLAYHRFLVSYSERRRYGQAGIPQNHFTFYQTQNPYHPNAAAAAPYQQRQDGGGAWTEPPPLYQNNDAPPQYFAPPPGAASKVHPSQAGNTATATMEMPQYGAPQGGAQQSGVVGASGTADVEQGETQALPPRPQAAKTRIMGFVERLRR